MLIDRIDIIFYIGNLNEYILLFFEKIIFIKIDFIGVVSYVWIFVKGCFFDIIVFRIKGSFF